MFRRFLFFAVIVAVAFFAAAAVFEFHLARRQQKNTIVILRGENALQIANDLKAEGYISSKAVFLLRVIRDGNLKNLKSGEYDLKGLGTGAIIDKLVNAETVAEIATVIPGWTIKDIADDPQINEYLQGSEFPGTASEKLRSEFDFLAGLPQNANLEGYLFPDTYQLPANTAADGLAALMLENFGKKLTTDMRKRINDRKISIHEAVIMASILEKEVAGLEDKKIVAGILWKRLEAKMPLQVDSTVLYSNNGNFDKDIDSPYNTYKYPGLPVGPICNPGLESFEAAIEPLETPYWFYLSAKDGTTIFSKTYDEHLANKAKYLDN